MKTYVTFLSLLLGVPKERLDTERRGLGMYGVDSLSGGSCQYWFYRGEAFFSSISASSAYFQCVSIVGRGHADRFAVPVELAIDIPVTKILGAGTISQVVDEAVGKLEVRGDV